MRTSMNPKTDKELQLRQYKEDSKEFVCEQAEHVVERNVGNWGSTDESDLVMLRDEIDALINICEKIDNCKSEKAVKKLMLKNYDKKELKFL